MSSYVLSSTIDELINVADSFGEEQVIRDVARRAGLLWTCVNDRCARENTGEGGACAYCSWPAPDVDLRPGEWRCVCMATNWGDTCRVCHRTQP